MHLGVAMSRSPSRHRVRRRLALVAGSVLLAALAPPVAAAPRAAAPAFSTAADPGDEDVFTPSLRVDLTREQFYFVMADRFANGDPANDDGGLSGDRLVTGFDPTNKGFYHGGDLQGLLEQLDYIEGLGTTAIWMTPSFKNRPVQGTGADASAGYHGYWTVDYTQIDPHLGTNADLATLVDAAHARGMKVFFDIITKTWVGDAGIDGFRIDTVKHVNLEFWQQFAPEIEGYAASIGNDDFFMFGEVFEGDPAAVSRYTTAGRLPAALDFPFQGAARSFASQGQPTDRLRDFFASDDWYTDADSNVYSSPTFLGNHDIGRIGGFIAQDNPGVDDATLLARDALAHELMFLVRGQPVIYAGDEQGFTGPGGDKDARQDQFASLTADYLDDDLLGTDRTHAQDNYEPGHPLYQRVAALSALTTTHPALRDGTQVHRYSTSAAGVYAFSRFDTADKVEYVVALNNSSSAQTAAIPTYSAHAGFTALYPSAGATATTAADATLTMTVPPLSAVVWRADGTVSAPPLPPAVAAGPAAGTEVTGRALLTADVVAPGPVQVTFAVRPQGADEWTVVGSDDNSPYRVYNDVSAFAPGTVLEVKAIAGDAAGQLASSTTTVSVVAPPAEPPPGGGAPDYLVVHYQRQAGDYDGWGAYVWGDVDPSELTTWPANHAFEGEDAYGRFVWIELQPGASNVGFIVQRDGVKDVDQDRFVNPRRNGEIWLKEGDATIYESQADAQGGVDLHYNRPGGDYPGWGVYVWGDVEESELTTWPANNPFDRTDSYGVATTIRTLPGGANVGYIVQRDGVKDVEQDRFVNPQEQPAVWLRQGDANGYPTRAAADNEALIHYHRPDGDYAGWGLHVWTGAASPTDWANPIMPAGQDGFGAFFRVPLVPGATSLSYIIHRGDEKDLPADQSLDLTTFGHEIFVLSGVERYLLPQIGGPGVDADLTKAKAQWISADTVAWDIEARTNAVYSLVAAPDGGLEVTPTGLATGRLVRLLPNPSGLTPAQLEQFPHLAGFAAFTVDPRDQGAAAEALRGQVAAQERSADGLLLTATGVQIPGVLDDLYAAAATPLAFGPTFAGGGDRTPTLRLWAPTARDVALELYDSADDPSATVVAMTRDDASGAWSVTGDAGWYGKYYEYAVTVWAPTVQQIVANHVTDPYSVALAANSTRSQVIDLDDPAFKSFQWDTLTKPRMDGLVPTGIYELHARDFSISDTTVPAAKRGTYGAFTLFHTDGMRRLRALADAGVSHVHLLPVFDIATIPERREDQATPGDLSGFPPDSTEQQAAVLAVADTDGFNWGYDPFHYTVPEGSYAANPNGSARTKEFREMVRWLNLSGQRVVVDVVYNHTPAAGQDPKSVLDQIVPGYYHRLLDDGTVATSTCCANTAPEHAMMGKLVVDSVVTWAKEYKVDGFRFDLMGHHPKTNMLAVRDALDNLTLAADGVDGQRIYVYGEGWDFGEVFDNARFEQATQANMAGTGIGTFNDRLRDAVRGGGPFDDDPRLQGFGSGLWTDPNESPGNGSPADQRARLLHDHDLIKVGLVGNLAGYEFVDSTGTVVTGADIDYNGVSAGYTADPDEAITYVDAHDNETLFDAEAFKLPPGTSKDNRVRMQVLSLSTVALGQGVPFVHAGTDRLRSKSLDRNSYNSGDWFNRLGWGCQPWANNFGSGLPPAPDNEPKWPYMQPLLADPALVPSCAQMDDVSDRFDELMEIGRSPLFSLGSAGAIQQRLSFPRSGTGETPGVVVMHISDLVGRSLDPTAKSVTVVFNAGDTRARETVPALARTTQRLHPVQASGDDAVVKTSTFDRSTGTFVVPPRTVAVFVQR